MVKPTQKAELVAVRAERLGRFPENKLTVLLGLGEPAPLVNTVLSPGQRHAVGRIKRTEATWNLPCNLRAHCFQNRQGECHAANALKKSAAVYGAR